MQSHRASLTEAAAKVVTEVVLSFAVQLVQFKGIGNAVSTCQHLLIRTAFYAQSIGSSDVLRRFFDAITCGHSQMPSAPSVGATP